MIKFQLFDSEKSYQCHFAEISTFVVSISHYMRAYFNYQALSQGVDFQLPADAAYLSCQPLQGVDGVSGMYAKIGCMERETFTSTKLQLILYTDQQCSVPYNDGQTARKHASRGYEINGMLVSSKVSFTPSFYSCLSCSPDKIDYSFNKLNSNWYDDDYISEHGNKNNANGGNDNNQNVQYAVDDLYYTKSDDGNQKSGNDDGYWKYSSYNADNNGNRRQLTLSSSELNRGIIQVRVEIAAFVDATLAASSVLLFSCVSRHIKMHFGRNTRRYKDDSTTTTTMTSVNGICASESTSMECGVTKNVVPWTCSEQIRGRRQIFSCSPSCAPF